MADSRKSERPRLIDSDVLVWLTRGHRGAATRLQSVSHWRISAVTYMELAQGCRDQAELIRLKKGLTARNTEVIPITPAISQRAMAIIDALGACRAWGVDSEKRPQRGQFLPDLQAHSPAMGQKVGKKWTAEAVSQPTIPKSDRLLALSHGMRLADALIGATAIEFQAALLTANVKHFSPMSDLQIEAFTP